MWIGVLFAMCVALSAAGSEDAGDREQLIRGALIYKFAKFVEWPSRSATPSSFILCVLRDPAFAALIRRKADGLSVHGSPVEVRSLEPGSAARDCQVVFVSPSTPAELAQVLRDLESLPVLTVGSQPNFLEAGGMINFVVRDETIRFVVNLVAAQRVGLAMDARLLQAADKVESGR